MNIKLITSVFLVALISFVLGLFNHLPWFTYAIGIFIIYIAIPQPPAKSFVTAALTVFFLYAIMCIKIDFDNEHLLSKKVATIFMLKDKYWVLYILTCVLNGLVAGMSALTGSLFRSIFKRRRLTY